MNYQRSTGNTGTLTSLTLKVLSVENVKSPWTSICTRCQKNAVLGKLYLFLRLHHCANVTSLPSFCLVLSPNACFPFCFFFILSVPFTFLLHLGCLQLSREKKNVIEDFKHSYIAKLHRVSSPASTTELGSLLIMSSPHLAKISAELE